MYTKCCVSGCNSTRQDAKFHKFPKCEKRRNKWLDAVNCASLRALSTEVLCRRCLCDKHFETRFFTQKSHLRVNAYPTLFSETEIFTGVPTSSDLENHDPNIDHDYIGKKHEDHSYATSIYTAPVPNIDHDYCLPMDQSNDYATDFTQIEPLPSTSKTTIDYCNIQSTKVHVDAVPVFDGIFQYTTKEIEASSPIKAGATFLEESKQQPKRKRLVQDVKMLSPTCKKLYNEYRKTKKLLSFTRRAKKARKFSKEESFEKLTASMKPETRTLLWMQIKNCTKKEKGRRFTLDEKVIALAIQKQSPKAYKFLQKVFILPSESSLKKMLAKLVIGPGINPQIFSSIKQEVVTWTEEKKYCSIVFDEMALDAAVTYTQKDYINGFVHLNERTSEFADHVLCFMIKGAVCKWQQAIAYYFCEGATKAIELKTILKAVIDAVGATGLVPVALISDQGTSFQSALKSFQKETRREQLLAAENIDDTIHIGGFKLNVVFDAPHLIKGIRNNFLTKDMIFNGKKARWSDLVDVYKMDCVHAETRLLHKLNDEHVIPEKIKKMKVKNCVRVFSNTMAGALAYTSKFSHYIDGKPVSDTLLNTSKVISFMDKLFDSVNGAQVFSKKSKGKALRSAVTKTSMHHTFWNEALQQFTKMKFLDKKSNEVTVPSLENWLVTLKSFQKLWHFFEKKGIKIMRPRYFNSDGIENFFGKIRAYNLRNNNPDCHSFLNTFKSLLITGFIKFHYSSFNCEDESSYQLIKIKSLFEQPQGVINDIGCENIDIKSLSQTQSVDLCISARRERLNIHARAYTAGWLLRKVLSKQNCNECKKNLTTSASDILHKWVSEKEYSKDKNRLCYASEPVVMLFGDIIKTTNLYLDSNAHQYNLSKNITNVILKKGAFEFITCPNHKHEVIQVFLSTAIRLCIHNWCNTINKILKGTDIVRLERISYKPIMQAKALNKFKKKLKKNPNK